MGQLRSAVHALAHSTGSPAELLARLDRFAERVEGARYSTACYAILDLTRQELRYAAAAHLPPLLVHRDRVEFLEGGRSTPLCGGSSLPRREETTHVPPGTTLVFYTDGLVERRREALDDGLARLATVVAEEIDLDPEDLSDRVVERLLTEDAVPDDAALVLLRFLPVASPLARRVPADAVRLRDLRRDLRVWLAEQGICGVHASELVLACSEALSNAVEHAYPAGSAGEMELRAERDGTSLRFTIRDEGRWRSSQAVWNRGRGTPIMEAFADSLDVVRDAAGTTVTITRDVSSANVPRPTTP
jgi:anti-sigma regulatory factor (Ser/Thr protein kinase)